MNLKERLSQAFQLRRLFLWGNILLLVLFVLAIAVDQKRGWAPYQKEFRAREIARAQEALTTATTDEGRATATSQLKAAKASKIAIRQIWAQEIKAVDRCITCHVGYDPLGNPTLLTPYKEQPFSAPDNPTAMAVHKAHNLEKFGCVICHGGQGTATEVADAHGHVPHWETPLLTGVLLQASCAKCHDNVKTLEVNSQVYTRDIVLGRKLVNDHGCLGCHQIGGEGGPVSVDFKEETSVKPLSRIDFSYSGLKHEDWTLINWIRIHFTQDPMWFAPGDPEAKVNTEPIAPSAMPPYLLPDMEANALTAFILGLNRSTIPPQYLVLRAPEAEVVYKTPLEKGRHVYEKFGCTACHGWDGRGGIRNYNSEHDVTPNLRRAVSTYSREQLREKISEGVPIVAKLNPHGPQPPLYMPAWKSKIKGEDLENLITYLQSIRE